MSTSQSIHVAAASKVIILGHSRDDGYSLLTSGLMQRDCQVIHCAQFSELSTSLIAQANLIFVFVSSFPGSGLFARIGAMIGDAPDISVIPVVEYADQQKAAAWLGKTQE